MSLSYNQFDMLEQLNGTKAIGIDGADMRTINSLALKGFIKVTESSKGKKAKITVTGKKALKVD